MSSAKMTIKNDRVRSKIGRSRMLSANVNAKCRLVRQRQRSSEMLARKRSSAKSESRRKKKTTIGSLRRSSRGTRIDACWLHRRAMRLPRLRGNRRRTLSKKFSKMKRPRRPRFYQRSNSSNRSRTGPSSVPNTEPNRPE